MAYPLGAEHVLDVSVDLGPQVRRLLGGHGADLVLECSGRVRALGQALGCGTPFPKVVAVGVYDEPGSDERLAEECCRSGGHIHHSHSGGFWLPPDGLGNGAFRKWSFARINAAVIRLIHVGKLRVDGLITHRFPLERAAEAYELIDTHPERVLRVIFKQSSGA